MALTAEQQSQLDMQVAQQQLSEAAETARRDHEKAMENLRHANSMAIAQAQAASNLASINAQSGTQVDLAEKQRKLELVRLAKEALIENRRTQPAATATDIAAKDIIAFASALESHVNS